MKTSFYNGEYRDSADNFVSHLDRAVYFGDGVYEVVRIYDGEFYTLEEHVLRLLRSAKEIGIESLSVEEITAIFEELKRSNEIVSGTIYLQVSRGIKERNHLFPEGVKPVILAFASPLERPFSNAEDGVIAITRDDYRWLKCHVKSLNLLGNILEKEKAKQMGAQEAILHRGQTVTEGTSTNVFVMKDGILYTPPADNYILNGITRREVITIAELINIPVREEKFSVDFLYAADEVIITSTTQELTPVIKIDDIRINKSIVGPITRRLQKEFEIRIKPVNQAVIK